MDTGPLACNTTGFYGTSSYPTGRHNGGANFTFWDGHVKWLPGTSVVPGDNARLGAPTFASNPAEPACAVTGVAGGTQGTLNGGPIFATYSIL